MTSEKKQEEARQHALEVIATLVDRFYSHVVFEFYGLKAARQELKVFAELPKEEVLKQLNVDPSFVIFALIFLFFSTFA